MKAPSAEVRGIWCPVQRGLCYNWPECTCIQQGRRDTGSHEPPSGDARVCPTCGASPIDGVIVHMTGCTDHSVPIRTDVVVAETTHRAKSVASHHPQSQQELDQMLADWDAELARERPRRQPRTPPKIAREER